MRKSPKGRITISSISPLSGHVGVDMNKTVTWMVELSMDEVVVEEEAEV